jgi:hypothetical protein
VGATLVSAGSDDEMVMPPSLVYCWRVEFATICWLPYLIVDRSCRVHVPFTHFHSRNLHFSGQLFISFLLSWPKHTYIHQHSC